MKFETLSMQIKEFQGSNTMTIKDAGIEKRIHILRKILSLFTSIPDDRVQG